jgi:ankyrin repeat protein
MRRIVRNNIWFLFIILPGCAASNPQNGEILNNGTHDESSLINNAIDAGDTDRLKELLSGATNIDFADDEGNTPLHRAAFRKNIDIVKYLLSKGSDVNAKDNMGLTPLHCAIWIEGGNADIVRELIKHRASVDILIPKGLKGHFKNPRASMYMGLWVNGWAPIHLAAFQGNEGIVKALLAAGADPDLKTQDGETALAIATREGNTGVVNILSQSPKNK